MNSLIPLMDAIKDFQNAPAKPVKSRLALTRKVRVLASGLQKPLPADVQGAVDAARAYFNRYDDLDR